MYGKMLVFLNLKVGDTCSRHCTWRG